MRSTSEDNIISALKNGPMSLEDLALAVGRGKKIEVIQIDNDFRDDIWTLLDAHKIDLDWNLGICLPK